MNVGRVRTEKRKYFFTQRVINLWKSFPLDVVIASGLDTSTIGNETNLWGEIPSQVTIHDE